MCFASYRNTPFPGEHRSLGLFITCEENAKRLKQKNITDLRLSTGAVRIFTIDLASITSYNEFACMQEQEKSIVVTLSLI